MPSLAFYRSRPAGARTETWPERLGTWTLLAIVVVYLALVVPPLMSQGINWDEQVDLTIASDYLDGAAGLVVGSDDDKSQTRLPMYSVALLSLITGGLSLALGRTVSVAVSVLTLLGIYIFCRRWLDAAKGLVAAAIVATSPYFLAFSGLAFTEGDAFITCAAVWVLAAGSGLLQTRTVGAAVLAGAALGLAVSSKFLGVALIPAVVFALFVPGSRGRLDAAHRRTAVDAVAVVAPPLMVGATTASAGSIASKLRSFLGHDLIRYTLVVALSFACLGWAWLHRNRTPSNLLASAIVVTATILTFLVVPPVHTTNSRVVRELLETSADAAISPAQVAEFAVFHAAVLMLKPGMLIGFGLVAGLLAAVVRFGSRPELRLPVFMAVFYLGFVSFTPVAQPFYMMPVFPLLAILMADWLVELGRRHRSVFGAIVLSCLAMLGWDLAASYPDFALNGYQWTGERFWAGRATLGYRGIAQVRLNGVEEILSWAQDNIPEGDVVVGFISAPHVVRAVAPNPPYVYVDAFDEDFERACPNLACADWILSHINSHILQRYDGTSPADSIYRYRFDRALVEAEFRKVCAIDSAYDIEVATVWRRRNADASPQ